MRRATMSTAWLLSPTGEVEGLSLGADACTEHECGIGGLRDAFGAPQRFENGLADRRAQRRPPALGYFEYTTEDGQPAAWLIVGNTRNADLASHKTAHQVLPPFMTREAAFLRTSMEDEGNNLVCAWDEDGALVHVRTPQQIRRLKQLYQAMEAGDIAFGGNLIDDERHPRTGGLVFVRPSMVSPEIAARVLAKDQSAVRLRAAAAALGIEAELRAAGKRWYALSPRWKDASESEVVFWLNPMDQQDHHYGAFTVDQLRQWARNEGPVMIDKPLEALKRKHEKELSTMCRRIDQAGYRAPWLSVEWKDDARQDTAIRIRYGVSSEPGEKPRLEEGLVELDDLRIRFPAQPPAPRKAPKPRKR